MVLVLAATVREAGEQLAVLWVARGVRDVRPEVRLLVPGHDVGVVPAESVGQGAERRPAGAQLGVRVGVEPAGVGPDERDPERVVGGGWIRQALSDDDLAGAMQCPA